MTTRKRASDVPTTNVATTLSMETVTLYGVMAYAVTTEPYVTPHYGLNYVDLTEVYRRLDELEAKLDELLRRSGPNADILDDIRKRVNDAIDGIRPPKRKR
jgi:hypothetical protein